MLVKIVLRTVCKTISLSHNRVDFENLKEMPVLVLDVNEDFKNDKIKQEYLIDEVSKNISLHFLLR